MRGLLLILTIAAVLAVVVAPCTAGDVWEDLMPGVRHLHRTTTVPWDIHVITIDLTNPRVDLRVGIKNDNDKPDSGETVSSLCSRYNAVAGINCDFFAFSAETYFDHRHMPQGHCVTDGLTMLPWGESSPIVPTRTTMQIPADNSFVLINTTASTPSWWWNVTAGGPRILRNGKVWGDSTYTWDTEGLGSLDTRQPRTGAAISQDYHTLILATVDGRQSSSAGMTSAELGTLLKDFGGYNGMGFDSGGSTEMVINNAVVNHPSDGSERLIANSLMLLDKLRQGGTAVHYETGFESPPFGAGALSGVDGWVGQGEVISGGHGGTQCARFTGGSAYRNVTTSSQTGVQWFECYAKVGSTSSGGCIYTGTANAADIASAVRFGSSGQIEAYDKDPSGSGLWKSLGAYSADTWYRIHVRLDYNINSYQVFIDGALKGSGLSFTSASANSGLRSVRFTETGGAGLCVDDVYVGSSDPDFVRVSPNALSVAQGGKKQFQAVSAVTSATWSVIDERDALGTTAPAGTIAQISSAGVLTTSAPGSCKVQVQDTLGRVDTSGSITIRARQGVASAKTLANGAEVALSGLIVTGRFAGAVYAEEPSRGSGIRIITAEPIDEGSEIWTIGQITTVDGERVVNPIELGVNP